MDSLRSVAKTWSLGGRSRLFDDLGVSHGDGIGFLAAGTADDPDADGFAAGVLLEEGGEDFLFEHIKGFGVAEEAGDADEQVGVEIIEFAGIAFEKLGVGVEGIVACEEHAAVEAAANGAGFIEGKVDAAVLAKDLEAAVVIFGIEAGGGEFGVGGLAIGAWRGVGVAVFGGFGKGWAPRRGR